MTDCNNCIHSEICCKLNCFEIQKYIRKNKDDCPDFKDKSLLVTEEYCKHCNFSNSDVGEIINTSGDDFVMVHNEDGVSFCSDDKHFLAVKVNYCPICGRNLENKGA